jgi:PAS domain-containing protein
MDDRQIGAPRRGNVREDQLKSVRGATEAGFRQLYNNIPLMCFKMNAEGTVRSVNRHAAEELGYPSDELVAPLKSASGGGA